MSADELLDLMDRAAARKGWTDTTLLVLLAEFVARRGEKLGEVLADLERFLKDEEKRV